MNYVLDACAVLAYLNDEEGADVVEALLNRKTTGEISLSMSIVNLLEVYYNELRDKDAEIAQVVLDMVQHYSITVIDRISGFIFREASRLKVAHKMSLADAIGLATRAELSGTFVSSDHSELENVEKREQIPFLWLPPRPKK
jgi:PIN domain nuclease of toxin-antitoxin system